MTESRPPAGASPGVLTRLATSVLLLAAGVVTLFFALRLTAVAVGSAFSPFPYLALPAGHRERALLLLGALVLVGLLLWLVLRHGERTLWLAAEEGGVLVPAGLLEGLAEQAARRDPDVVRAEARLRLGRGGLRGVLRV
ncbi:MAG: hypothetical protein WC709_11295, partial [Thermoleophilia bacterium]